MYSSSLKVGSAVWLESTLLFVLEGIAFLCNNSASCCNVRTRCSTIDSNWLNRSFWWVNSSWRTLISFLCNIFENHQAAATQALMNAKIPEKTYFQLLTREAPAKLINSGSVIKLHPLFNYMHNDLNKERAAFTRPIQRPFSGVLNFIVMFNCLIYQQKEHLMTERQILRGLVDMLTRTGHKVVYALVLSEGAYLLALGTRQAVKHFSDLRLRWIQQSSSGTWLNS